MFARHLGGGLAAASFALALFFGAAPAAAGAAPWWAPAPGVGVVPGRYAPVPPPVFADAREAWRAAQSYRWRPLEAARPVPLPVRAGWGPRPAPLPGFAMPAPVTVAPWGRSPPPRVAAWRTPAPLIVTVEGTPYRFRPVAPWRGPMVSQPRHVPGPIGYPAYAPRPPPQPMLAAQWPAGAAPSAVFPPAQPWLQPPGGPPSDGWHGYRFRPDPRFASRGAGPWAGGPPRGPDSAAWAPVPGGDSAAVPAQRTEPLALWGRTVAYRFD